MLLRSKARVLFIGLNCATSTFSYFDELQLVDNLSAAFHLWLFGTTEAGKTAADPLLDQSPQPGLGSQTQPELVNLKSAYDHSHGVRHDV